MQKTQTESTLYPHPFSLSYWKDAAKECTRTRSLCIAALLCALTVVVELFQIPLVPPSQYLSFSFPVISLCSMLTGPIMAIYCGILVDVIGYLLSGNAGNVFFAGYTLTAVLTAVVFALFLYRAKVSFARIAIAKGCVNFFINVLLGSCWRVLLYKGMSYPAYVALSGVKNFALLPLEVFLTCLFFRALQKPLRQFGFLQVETELRFNKKSILLLCIPAAIGAALLLGFVYGYDDIKLFLQTHL